MGKKIKHNFISLVVPAYNEQENIKPLVEQFAAVIKSAGKDWEVILINDGSNDRTESIARGYSKSYPWLKVLSHPVNRGLTSALNTGFKIARYFQQFTDRKNNRCTTVKSFKTIIYRQKLLFIFF